MWRSFQDSKIHGNRNITLRRRGLTFIEIIFLIIITIILVALMLIYYEYRQRRVCSISRSILCMGNIKNIYQAMTFWSESHKNIYPTPLMDEADLINKKCAQKGNSTANIYSMMIFNRYFDPETAVCPSEANDFIQVHKEINFNSNTEWDWDFGCDITGKTKSARTGKYFSNVSYANLALIGKRYENEWNSVSKNANFPVLSDRGPRDGIHDPASLVYLNHSTKDAWKGNVGFNDSHVDTLTEQVDTDNPFVFPQAILKDNIFAEDDTVNRADIWLAVFGDSDFESVTPLWDPSVKK